MFQRMVPPKFTNHNDCREGVCCCCGVKTTKKHISVKEEALVVEFAKKEYDSKVQSYPAGVCSSCRRLLFMCAKAKKNKVIVSIFETDYDPDITFSTKEGPGNRLTGSSRMLVMALCDDLQVKYFFRLNQGICKFG